MNRREMFTSRWVLPLASLADREAGPKELPPFWTSRLSDVDAGRRAGAEGAGPRAGPVGGRAARSTWSPTARPSTASRPPITTRRAAGMIRPPTSRKDGAQRPVVLLLGPVHGAEFEGLVGLLHLLRVAETGADGRGGPGASWRRTSPGAGC